MVSREDQTKIEQIRDDARRAQGGEPPEHAGVPEDLARHVRAEISKEQQRRAGLANTIVCGSVEIGSEPQGGALHGAAAIGPKCLVKGCMNHFGQGTFIGPLCMPCDRMLRTGNVGYSGTTFVHDAVLDAKRLRALAVHKRAHELFTIACKYLDYNISPQVREVAVSAIIEALKEGGYNGEAGESQKSTR